MDEASVDRELRTLTGWERDGDRIVKTFVFDSFRSAAMFVSRVADAAAALGHTPRIWIDSNEIALVTLAISTPGAATVTGADLALARRAQRLTGDHQHPVGMAGP